MDKIVMPKPYLSNIKYVSLASVLVLFLTACAHQEATPEREPSSQKSRPLSRTTERKVPFESCDVKHNSYLESKLLRMPQEYLMNHENEGQTRIPLQCIQLAQARYVGHYAICENENEKPKITVIKPCMSEAYVNLTANAYHDVMDCFNLDPRDMYYQIMIESGFHINAINKSGFDSGMAQFTANGIKRVMSNNLIERSRRVLLESSRPSCQRISSVVGAFDADSFSVEKRCSMIALPKNPYRAMFFSYLHTMLDQISLDKLLSGVPEIHEALSDRVRRQLLFMSYNRGMTGLMRLLRGYVDSRNYFGHRITEDDLDLNKNLSRVKAILSVENWKRDLLKKSKVKNMTFAEYAIIHGATYLSDMAAARDYVEQYYGDSCGEF